MKSPGDYARWVRRVHGLEEVVPLDVDDLARRCGITVAEETINSFLGLWLRVGSVEGIILDKRQGHARRRFTLAHELGHSCIPTHRKSASLRCLAVDLSGKDSGSTVEAQANEFAAELLAPRKLVAPLLKTGALSLAKAEEIADRFEISLTCAARCVIEHGAQPAALVLTEGGQVSWCVRRHGFPYGLPGNGDRVPPDTMAHFVEHGEDGSRAPRQVSSTAWLPMISARFTVMESAIRLGSLGQVISLLWIPDLEQGPPEDED